MIIIVVLLLFNDDGDDCRLRLLKEAMLVDGFVIVNTKNNNIINNHHRHYLQCQYQYQRQRPRPSMSLWSRSIQNVDDEMNVNRHSNNIFQSGKLESASTDATTPEGRGGGVGVGQLDGEDDEKNMDNNQSYKFYDSEAYSIHRVDSRQRILDLLVFRHNKTTLEEYLSSSSSSPSQSQSQAQSQTTSTNPHDDCDDHTVRDDALRQLTRFYDDNGQDLMFVTSSTPSPLSPSTQNDIDRDETTENPYSLSSSSSSLDYCELAQFYVLWHHYDNDGDGDAGGRGGSSDPDNNTSGFIDQTTQHDGLFHRTNGIVGSVDARRMSLDNIEKGMEETLEDILQKHKQSEKNTQNNNDDVVLVELKNLRVHPSMRRKGIGKALIETVQEYAKSILPKDNNQQQQQQQRTNEVIVFLQVDPTNIAAQQLYEQTGFVSTRKEFGRMDWKTTQ